jgi:hypothetical protein
MITGKLINPRIIYKDGEKYRFENTLVLERDGIEIDRMDIGYLYAMPDPEIEQKVKEFIVQYAYDLALSELEEGQELPKKQPLQDTLQWDWMEWDNAVL